MVSRSGGCFGGSFQTSRGPDRLFHEGNPQVGTPTQSRFPPPDLDGLQMRHSGSHTRYTTTFSEHTMVPAVRVFRALFASIW